MAKPTTRRDAKNALSDFAPRMGASYAARRNFDFGQGHHDHVSCLSPYLRHRVITEREVVETALAHHGLEASDKFIQEVFWRSYFKGFLEHNPAIWQDYWTGLVGDYDRLTSSPDLAASVVRAEAGETGLSYFDAWARELVETGYLHNHARMWFASIWIFTLKLPWRLGADFFLRHLLDGDPASNTLSWRWVAGLHTKGKAYAATAENIARFTQGRHSPATTDLAPYVTALEEAHQREASPLRTPQSSRSNQPSALVLTGDDVLVSDFDPTRFDVRVVYCVVSRHMQSPKPVSAAVRDFERGVLNAASLGMGHTVVFVDADAPEAFVSEVVKSGVAQIIMPYATQGPLAGWAKDVAPKLAEIDVVLAEWQRDWDRKIWPLATAGFFKVKKKIPKLLSDLGMI